MYLPDARSRPSFPLVAAALALCLAACDAPRFTRDGDGRGANVLLIVVDTLRADELRCYGASDPVSPAMDALARRGTLFDRAVSASSYTAPSHASIMTSLYPRQHSLGYGNGTIRLGPERALAEHLERAGYDTAAFVSNPILKRRIGLDRGFSVYDDELEERELNRPASFERTARHTTSRALAWLESRERPFFLWVHYQDPHGPYTPPAPFDTMFAPPEAPAAREDAAPLPLLDDHYGRGGIPAYQRLPGLTETAAYRARYRGEIRSLDDSIGELVAAVEALGPTFVVLTADHGEAFGENDFYLAHGHACTPDQSHVPFIVAGPGVSAQRRPGLVGHVDILPTVLDLVALEPPDTATGRSLRDVLLSPGTPLPEETYFCDAGFELTAYRGDTFLRAQGPAWSSVVDEGYKSGRANVDGTVATEDDLTAVGMFRWSSAESWSAAATDPDLLGEVYAYWRGVAASSEQVEIPAEDLERLRALGYVPP